MNELNLKGGCLCGSIKFKTYGWHRDVHNCHCLQCTKSHGNYAAYTCIKQHNIVFLKKKTLRWYKSSKRAKRGFCKKCGASLFFKVMKSNIVHISAGIFDRPTRLKTTTNIFVKNKADYYILDNHLPKFQRYKK